MAATKKTTDQIERIAQDEKEHLAMYLRFASDGPDEGVVSDVLQLWSETPAKVRRHYRERAVDQIEWLERLREAGSR